MSKISINFLEKIFLKDWFKKSVKKTETVAAQITEKTENEPAKVTSKYIEAYYKKYDKHLSQKSQSPKVSIQEQEPSEIQNAIEQECRAYNRRRGLEVSEEALKSLEQNFDEKKEKVIQIVQNHPEYFSKKLLKQAKNIKTTEDLALVVRTYPANLADELNNKSQNLIEKTIQKKGLSLKEQQKLFKTETEINDIILELIKSVLNPSSDEKVIQIENYLKRTYKMDFVHLESLEEAEKILKTIDIVKKHNIPLPKNIIITPFTMANAYGINLPHSMDERSIIIQSRKEIDTAVKEAYEKFTSPYTVQIVKDLKLKDLTYYSTDDELHLYVHEFVHSGQNEELLLPFKCKKVPYRIIDIANHVSDYAVTTRLDMDAEVKTKKIMRSLNEKEKEVLEYFQ